MNSFALHGMRPECGPGLMPENLDIINISFQYLWHILEGGWKIVRFVIPPSRHPPKPNRKGKAPDIGRNSPRPPRKGGPAANGKGGREGSDEPDSPKR